MSTSFRNGWVAVAASPGDLQTLREGVFLRDRCVAVELRLDLWAQPLALPAIEDCDVPVIVTVRRAPHLNDHARQRFLREAMQRVGSEDTSLTNVWFDLDVDDPVDRGLLNEHRVARACQVIGSSHKYSPVSDSTIRGTVDEIASLGCAAAKVVLAEDGVAAIRQALRLGSDYRTAPMSVSVTAAGDAGVSSRVLSVQRDQGWSYSRVPGSAGSAAGQPPLARLGEWWGTRSDLLYGVVGADVADSISPPFHNEVLARHGAPGTFLSFPLLDPTELLSEAPELTLDGLAVTTPHKEWARAAARPATAADATYRSFNTLWRDAGGSWVGTNTDASGAIELLASAGLRVGETVALLGAGGAALGIAEGLRQRGFEVLFVARSSAARASAVAAVAGAAAVATLAGDAEVAAVINATGSSLPEALLSGSRLPASTRVALELSYRPMRTEFASVGEAAGCRVIDGVEFFAAQARQQVRALYGADLTIGDAAVLARHAVGLLGDDQGASTA
ncbi:MAG: type I 3-dehydroquinate dehydratase [Planctomycetota bacterium]